MPGNQKLDAFHQKCLRQPLGIRWYDRVRNDEVLQRTGLTSLSHLLSRRRISVFGHVARLDDVTPANVALQLHIDVSLNRPPDRTWRRPPGRPRNNWLYQLLLSARPRFHASDWRPLEACCRPWTWWCNDATALAGYATMMMMMKGQTDSAEHCVGLMILVAAGPHNKSTELVCILDWILRYRQRIPILR